MTVCHLASLHNPCSLISHWQMKTGHGRNIYTTETGKYYESWLISLPYSKSQLLASQRTLKPDVASLSPVILSSTIPLISPAQSETTQRYTEEGKAGAETKGVPFLLSPSKGIGKIVRSEAFTSSVPLSFTPLQPSHLLFTRKRNRSALKEQCLTEKYFIYGRFLAMENIFL